MIGKIRGAVIGTLLLIGVLGVPVAPASAHSSCGTHSDWHTIKFHTDWHHPWNTEVIDYRTVRTRMRNTTHYYYYSWYTCRK